MIKLKIKKGDTVKVIAGDDKGKSGVVRSVDKKTLRVIVVGVNMVKRHTKPSAAHPEGGILEKEAGIHISNLMLMDTAGTASRISKRSDENRWVRVSKKSGEVIK